MIAKIGVVFRYIYIYIYHVLHHTIDIQLSADYASILVGKVKEDHKKKKLDTLISYFI